MKGICPTVPKWLHYFFLDEKHLCAQKATFGLHVVQDILKM